MKKVSTLFLVTDNRENPIIKITDLDSFLTFADEELKKILQTVELDPGDELMNKIFKNIAH